VPKPGCRCTARGSRADDSTPPSRWRASPSSPWADLPGSLVRNAAGARWGSCDQGRRPGGELSRRGGGPSAGGDRGGGRPGGGADQGRVDAIAFAAITVEGATGPLPRLSGGDDAPWLSTVIAISARARDLFRSTRSARQVASATTRTSSCTPYFSATLRAPAMISLPRSVSKAVFMSSVLEKLTSVKRKY
jgi:hypothetical protein